MGMGGMGQGNPAARGGMGMGGGPIGQLQSLVNRHPYQGGPATGRGLPGGGNPLQRTGGGMNVQAPTPTLGVPPGQMTGGPDNFAAPTPTLGFPPGQMTGGQDNFGAPSPMNALQGGQQALAQFQNPIQRGAPAPMGGRPPLIPPGNPPFGPGPASPIPPGYQFPQFNTSGIAPTGTWIDDYLKPGQADGVAQGFTGTQNNRNYINGNPYAAQFNASGGNEFNNLIAQQWIPRMQGLLGK